MLPQWSTVELSRPSCYNGRFVLACRHWAAASGNAPAVRVLVHCGADLNASSTQGSTPLHLLPPNLQQERQDEYLEVARVLVDAGASTSAVDIAGKVAAQWAEENGQFELARIMRSGMVGANNGPNKQAVSSSRGDPEALRQAAARGDLGTIRSLLAAGTNINIADDEGDAPLVRSASTMLRECLQKKHAYACTLNCRGAPPRRPGGC